MRNGSILLIFTCLFAVGVILISQFSAQVDIDQDCVLHGEIAYVPLDVCITASGINLGPVAVWTSAITLFIVLAFIFIGFKGLKLTTFDPEYATSIGISTVLWHNLLMAAVSLTTVVSFESVGAVLVVAFLVVPPAIAYLLTDNLIKMFVISSIAGIIAAIGGYFIAAKVDGSIAGAMTVVLAIEFVFVLILAPKYGIFKRRNQTILQA